MSVGTAGMAVLGAAAVPLAGATAYTAIQKQQLVMLEKVIKKKIFT